MSPLRLVSLAALAALAACTTAPTGQPASAAAPAPAPAASPAASPRVATAVPGPAAGVRPPAGTASAPAAVATPPQPGQPAPFALVIKDAKKSDGLFTVWRKDEKVWFELAPADFNKPLFLSPKLATGIGEARIFAGTMSRPHVVEFRRMHNQVQLLALNTAFIARSGTPEARAVASTYSPSLLASTPVASQPHPERKTVLIDASALFVSDMLAIGLQLQRVYRQGYGLDPRNSAVMAVRATPDMLVLEVTNHYATGNIAVPQPGAPAGAPVPSVPRSLPDPRSLFINLHYSLARLPAVPMATRRADQRIGHFVQAQNDFGDDLARTPRVRHINRWRLEKQDPAAELSEPVKPITYWIDKTVPLKYRDTLSAGILEWNKAFERIGFKNAIVVKVQPDDAPFDTLDFGVASVRWLVNSQPVFGATGPSHVDPRTGEILDADISMESLSSRNIRSYRARIAGEAAQDTWARLLQTGTSDGAAARALSGAGPSGHDLNFCDHADAAGEQLDYGLDVLAARGEIDPDSPEARQFTLDYLKEVMIHEVGHTLGLRHNFRASRIYTEQQVSDPEFTRTHGLTGSIMEYTPINLALPGAPRPQAFQTTLGPYDYWAIEYAYKPLAPDQEAAELSRIASRSGEPELAYGTDEDNFIGIDPDALQGDLGRDPIVFARKRFEIAQDLFKRQEGRMLAADQDYGALRRALAYALRDAGRAAGSLLRQIGGVRTLRDYPNTGRDPMQPVPAADQRLALDTLARHLLAADSLVVSPALQRRLAPDFLERADSVLFGDDAVPTDYPLAQAVHELRRALLTQLMSDPLASRVLDNEAKSLHRAETFQLSELYRRLEADVWSELSGKGDIPAARRELQREHLGRLANAVLRPGAVSRTDARSQLRSLATALAQRIEQAERRPGLGDEARLHLKDSAQTLRAALAAPLARTGI